MINKNIMNWISSSRTQRRILRLPCSKRTPTMIRRVLSCTSILMADFRNLSVSLLVRRSLTRRQRIPLHWLPRMFSAAAISFRFRSIGRGMIVSALIIQSLRMLMVHSTRFRRRILQLAQQLRPCRLTIPFLATAAAIATTDKLFA